MRKFLIVLGIAGWLWNEAAQAQPPGGPPASPPAPGPSGPGGASKSQFSSGSVEALEDLGSVIIRAPREQLEAMLEVIDQIDRISQLAQPDFELVPLQHADSESMVDALNAIYEARQAALSQENARSLGRPGFVALAQPNSVVVVAKRTDMEDVVAFVKQLDTDAAQAPDQFQVFPLERASAVAVQAKLQQFFTQRDDAARLRVRIEVLGDDRTNSVVVHGSPVDIAQAAKLIQQLDSNKTAAVNELRIFPLRNAIATELSLLLNQALNNQGLLGATGAQAGRQVGQQAFPGAGQQPGVAGQAAVPGTGAQGQQNLKITKLRFLAIDERGKPIESGIIEDITVLPDDRTNSLVVTAPPASMSLMEALIAQLDSLPNPAADLKVFTLHNSDALTMLETLQSIFLSTQVGGLGGVGAPGVGGIGAGVGGFGQTGTSAQPRAFMLGGQPGELSRIPISFAVDVRTNSIIVSATPQEMLAVEAVILKLESSTALQRRTVVYPLRNLLAVDAAAALGDFLSSQQQLAVAQEGRISFQEQIAMEVTVVPEPITNKLIVSSSPRFFDEVMRIISEIDTRPPQVVIQVLIAEVTLNETDELGVELGTQSSVLFDRSIVVNNQLTPGFNFNTTQPLTSLPGAPASEIGLQSLSNFALGRGNPALGFGGLILQASSDNLSILLRALQQQQRLDVLSRPQIMTSDSRTAFIQIGQNVPIVNGATVTQFGVVNQITRENVGIILQVTPRISPDGVVVMDVIPQVSALADTGVPIGVDASGATIEAPVINITQAQTNVAAADGQTVVIGGLIVKQDTKDDRKIPFLGDLPLVGWGFRYRQLTSSKRELLIILTPHIIYSEADAQYVKDMEARRIDWILSNVEAAHGDLGLTPPPAVVPRRPEPAECVIIEPSVPGTIVAEEVEQPIAVAEPSAQAHQQPVQTPASEPASSGVKGKSPEKREIPVAPKRPAATEKPPASEAKPSDQPQSVILEPVPLGKVVDVGSDQKSTMTITTADYQAPTRTRAETAEQAGYTVEELPLVLPEDDMSSMEAETIQLETVPVVPARKNDPPKRASWWSRAFKKSTSKGASK